VSNYELTWQWSSFEALTVDQIYQILAARQAIFIVEQHCPFQDADGLDEKAWHLSGWLGSELVAYARVVFPGCRFEEPSIGRVITARSHRRQGLGKALMKEAITRTLQTYPRSSIRISAQGYLEKFYGDFGFKTVSLPYDEDGIMHIDMLLKNG
jgi:ElaA protein